MQSSSPLHMQRKEWLDALKGWGILLVVMSHSYGVPYIHGYLTACFMPLFFLASGYTTKNHDGLVCKKWKQVLLPYIYWSVVYVILNICLGITAENFWYKLWGTLYSRAIIFPPLTSDSKRLFFSGAEPMWFLTCMAISYAAVVPLLKAKKKKLILLICAYLAISMILHHCPILLPWSIDTAFLGAIFILTGYLLKSIQWSRKGVWVTFIASAIAYIALVHINQGNNMSIRTYGIHGTWSVLLFVLIGIIGTITYAAFFILNEKNFICSFFAYLGRASLTIMCAHMLYLMIFRIIIKQITSNGVHISSYILIPTQLVLVLVSCLLTHKLLTYIKLKTKATTQHPASTSDADNRQ